MVDDFIGRIMIDPRLNANPRVDEAHHRVPPAGFKYLVTEMLCWAAGGPQKYTGRSMKDSHKDLVITAAEWEAFLDDLQQTLDKFAVPQPEQAEIKAIIDSTRADIAMAGLSSCALSLRPQSGLSALLSLPSPRRLRLARRLFGPMERRNTDHRRVREAGNRDARPHLVCDSEIHDCASLEIAGRARGGRGLLGWIRHCRGESRWCSQPGCRW